MKPLNIPPDFFQDFGYVLIIEERLNQFNLRNLKYRVLNRDVVLNLNYNTLYIVRDGNSHFYNYFLLVRVPNHWPGEGGEEHGGVYDTYCVITINYSSKRGWFLAGNRETWAYSAIRLDSSHRLFNWLEDETLRIATLPSGETFMNWNKDNPLEVK